MYDLNKTSLKNAGISSESICNFFDKIERFKMNIHSFAFVRNNKIFVEAYAKPIFDEEFKHRIYSCSKSIVSLAIGKLIDQNKVKLTDKICSYFPEYVDSNTDSFILQTTIEDMLKMAVPHQTDSYSMRKDLPWVEGFFKVKGVKPSGSIFNYNSSATFILGVLVEKLTGKTFLEYLRPEFDEIGVSKDIKCVKSPDGYAWGSSGVICSMHDFIRIALLVMNKGKCGDKQLISKSYIESATTKKIDNFLENSFSPRNSCGYGYQFWITDKGFSMYGMGSQYAFFFPDKNFIFVCMGDTQVNKDDFCGELLYDWVSDIYNELDNNPKLNTKMDAKLIQKINNFHLPSFLGKIHSDFENKINGIKYYFKSNEMGLKWIKLYFDHTNGVFEYENSHAVKAFKFCLGEYNFGTFPEKDFYGEQVDVSSNREQNCAIAAEWLEEQKLLIRVYITDTNFGNLFITLSFKDDSVTMLMQKKAEFFLNNYEGIAYGVMESN